MGSLPRHSIFLLGTSEKPPQIELSEEEVLEQVDEMNSNKSPRPAGVHPGLPRRLNYKTAELPPVMCNPCLPSVICQEMEVVNRILFLKNKSSGKPQSCLSAFHTKQIVRQSDEKKTRQIGWIDTGGMCCIAGLLESFRRAGTSVDEEDPLDTAYLASPKADDRSFTKLSA